MIEPDSEFAREKHRMLSKLILSDPSLGMTHESSSHDSGRTLTNGSRIKNFFVVRFNLYDKSKRDKAGIVDEEIYRNWVLTRTRWFQDFTLPTLVNQSASDTRVLVFVDEKQLELTRKLLEDLKAWPQVKQVLLDLRGKTGPWAFEDRLAEVVREDLDDVDLVATTRVDSDDAVNLDLVAAANVSAQAVIDSGLSEAPFFINFPFGAQTANGVLRVLMYNQNPFQTLYEPVSLYTKPVKRQRLGVFQASHARTHTVAPVLNVTTRFPMWVQFVHEANVSNRVASRNIEMVPSLELSKMFNGTVEKMLNLGGGN